MGLWAVNIVIYQEQDNGKVKAIKYPYLVNATDPRHAIQIIEEEYRGNSSRWKIASIRKSNVVDILNYSGVQDLSTRSEIDRSLMLND